MIYNKQFNINNFNPLPLSQASVTAVPDSTTQLISRFDNGHCPKPVLSTTNSHISQRPILPFHTLLTLCRYPAKFCIHCLPCSNHKPMTNQHQQWKWLTSNLLLSLYKEMACTALDVGALQTCLSQGDRETDSNSKDKIWSMIKPVRWFFYLQFQKQNYRTVEDIAPHKAPQIQSMLGSRFSVLLIMLQSVYPVGVPNSDMD
jgi:hypothetical protein